MSATKDTPSFAASAPSTATVRLDRTRRRRTLSEIVVLETEPREPYQAVAVIEANGSLLPALDKWIHLVAAEAARIGGDAVILGRGHESRGLVARVIIFRRVSVREKQGSLQATA